jgi:hypothetical protein
MESVTHKRLPRRDEPLTLAPTMCVLPRGVVMLTGTVAPAALPKTAQRWRAGRPSSSTPLGIYDIFVPPLRTSTAPGELCAMIPVRRVATRLLNQRCTENVGECTAWVQTSLAFDPEVQHADQTTESKPCIIDTFDRLCETSIIPLHRCRKENLISL